MRLKSSIIQLHHALSANCPPLHPPLNFYPLFTSLRDNSSDSFCLGQGQNCRNMLYDPLRVCCLIFLPLFFKPSEKLLQMISDDSIFLFPPLTTEEVAHSSLLIPSDVQLAKGCNLWCEVRCISLTANTHTCLMCKQRRFQVQTWKRGTSLVFLGIFYQQLG